MGFLLRGGPSSVAQWDGSQPIPQVFLAMLQLVRLGVGSRLVCTPRGAAAERSAKGGWSCRTSRRGSSSGPRHAEGQPSSSACDLLGGGRADFECCSCDEQFRIGPLPDRMRSNLTVHPTDWAEHQTENVWPGPTANPYRGGRVDCFCFPIRDMHDCRWFQPRGGGPSRTPPPPSGPPEGSNTSRLRL